MEWGGPTARDLLVLLLIMLLVGSASIPIGVATVNQNKTYQLRLELTCAGTNRESDWSKGDAGLA